MESEGTFPKSFYKTIIKMISKPNKDIISKKLYGQNYLMNIHAKALNIKLKNQIQQSIKKIIYHVPSWIHSKNARTVQHM
jgi:hypothetical protein